MSTQPGYRASRRRYGEFPSRDEWIRYLEDYATHHQIEVRFGTEARRVESGKGRWSVETDRGTMDADLVVVATGYDHDPDFPDWPGRESFTGDLCHSADYRSPEPYKGRDVLVVGPGTTGSEIAFLLARGGAARVRVACRTPPNLTARKFLGTSPASRSTISHSGSPTGLVGWSSGSCLVTSAAMDSHVHPRE